MSQTDSDPPNKREKSHAAGSEDLADIILSPEGGKALRLWLLSRDRFLPGDDQIYNFKEYLRQKPNSRKKYRVFRRVAKLLPSIIPKLADEPIEPWLDIRDLVSVIGGEKLTKDSELKGVGDAILDGLNAARPFDMRARCRAIDAALLADVSLTTSDIKRMGGDDLFAAQPMLMVTLSSRLCDFHFLDVVDMLHEQIRLGTIKPGDLASGIGAIIEVAKKKLPPGQDVDVWNSFKSAFKMEIDKETFLNQAMIYWRSYNFDSVHWNKSDNLEDRISKLEDHISKLETVMTERRRGNYLPDSNRGLPPPAPARKSNVPKLFRHADKSLKAG